MEDSRLSYYRHQTSKALREAERCIHQKDRDNRRQIAAEWQKLHETLSRDLGLDPAERTNVA